MSKPGRIVAALIAVAMFAMVPAVHASAAASELVDLEVPALKDGTRMALEDVERAILGACARGKFRATVIAPGMIKARKAGLGKHVEVTIPFTDSAYSIRFADALQLDEKANAQLTGLAGHIESDLDRALVRFKSLQKPTRRAKRINPRYAA